jgi:ABC-type transporter MlaC component
MRSLRRSAVLAVALTVVGTVAVARPAAAGAPLDQLKAQIDRVLKVVDDPELRKEGHVKDRRAAVRKIANDIFDFNETARRSLGRHCPRSSCTAARRSSS